MRRRFGRTAVWMTAAFAGAVLSGSMWPARAAETSTAGATVLPVASVGGRPVVTVELNHQGPFRFFVDTGSVINVLKPSLVAQLALVKKGTQRVHNIVRGKGVDADVFSVESVNAAGIELGPLPFLAMEVARHDDVQGVLSYRTLPPGLVSFDLQGGRIRIEPGELNAKDRGVIPFESDPAMSIKGEVGGKPATFRVDIGSQEGIVIPASLVGELKFERIPVVTRERGPLVVKTGKLKGKVTIGRLVLKNPEVQVTELFPDDGTLGSGFLSDRTLTIDREHSLLRIGESTSTSAK